MTMGEKFPRLLELPGYEAIAAAPVEEYFPVAPTTPPNLVQKAGNLAKAVVAHVADGLGHASPEVQAERERECRACPNLDQERDVCNLCGCLAMKLKRSWSSSACPDTPPRWEAVP